MSTTTMRGGTGIESGLDPGYEASCLPSSGRAVVAAAKGRVVESLGHGARFWAEEIFRLGGSESSPAHLPASMRRRSYFSVDDDEHDLARVKFVSCEETDEESW
jgi:hypothetical protein